MIKKTKFSQSQVHKVFNTLDRYGLIKNIQYKKNIRKKMFELTKKGKNIAKLFLKFKSGLRDVINGKKETDS